MPGPGPYGNKRPSRLKYTPQQKKLAHKVARRYAKTAAGGFYRKQFYQLAKSNMLDTHKQDNKPFRKEVRRYRKRSRRNERAGNKRAPDYVLE